MASSFSTKEFTFDEETLSLSRRAKIEEISFGQITMIELKKGSDLKRPKLAIVFGIGLMIFCLGILNSIDTEFIFSRGVIRILVALCFVGGIGVYLIYAAMPIHPVIEIRIKNVVERLSISSIIERGMLHAFSKFLNDKFRTKFNDSLRS